jgi:hypothetical protein
LSGKKLEVAFSTPKEKDDERPDADTLFVIKKGNSAPIDSGELSRVFAQWGELKRIGDNVRSPVQKFVQYYDTRAIARALKEAGGMAFGGGTLDVEEAKSNFSGRPPRERTRAGVSRRSRSRSRSNSRDRDRRSHRSSRRRRSRSRSNSPSSSSSSRKRRSSRSRSRSRSRSNERKPSSSSSSAGAGQPLIGSTDWAREAASASIYGMQPQPLPAFVNYVPQQQPQQQAMPQLDAQQVMALAQQNPQLIQMLLMQVQQQQQQPPQQQPQMMQAMQGQQQQRFVPQQQQQQQYQPMPAQSFNTNYSPPANNGRPLGGSLPPVASGVGTASLASLAASLERLKKK